MAIVEVRRHAERAGPTDAGSALSPAGRAMAERLARTAPAYAVVAASPLPRAKETAAIIGGRLDLTDPALLPDLSQIVQARTIEEYAPLLDEGDRERALAEEQAGAWARLGVLADGRERPAGVADGREGSGVVGGRSAAKDSAADDVAALVITHGGVIELAALRIARELGVTLRGDAFSYCEGVRVRYQRGRAVALQVLRA